MNLLGCSNEFSNSFNLAIISALEKFLDFVLIFVLEKFFDFASISGTLKKMIKNSISKVTSSDQSGTIERKS